MDELLHTLLTMSAAATVGALAVLVLRLFLKKAPRWITCLLWLAVFLRLVCPVGLSLPVSLPAVPTVQEMAAPVLSPAPVAGAPAAELPAPQDSPAPAQDVDPASLVLALWGAGTAGVLLWALWSARRLRRQVAEAVPAEPGVWESDQIPAPFLLGWVRPRIYLPAELTGQARCYVLLHERAHLRRRDHWAKLLAFLALALHWWNPVIHLAYRLFCRDLEVACDQAVIRDFSPQERAGYAETLLRLGQTPPPCQAGALAFAETETKHRIHHVLEFKRPPLLVALVALAVCALTVVLILSNPGDHGRQLDGVSITSAYVLDGGLPVELPEESLDALIPLLKEVVQGPYTTAERLTPQDGDVVLSSQTGGTVFYLQDAPSTRLVRVNHDGYSATVKVASGSSSLALSQDYAQWRGDLNQYLTQDLADQVRSLATPYLGNNSACGAILEALHLSAVAGSYTFSLQTSAEPYGITIYLEQPASQEDSLLMAYLLDVSTLFLDLVDNAKTVTWQQGGQVLAVFDQKTDTMDQEAFQNAYAQLRADAGAYRAALS